MSQGHVPIVSIVVTALNEQDTIAQCIESLLNQDYPEKEIIIVDGGSSDRTFEIASTYPIKVVQERKKGPSAGRNKGVAISNGEIIAFTDADCVADRLWLKELIKSFKDSNASVVGGSVDILNNDNFIANCIASRFQGRKSVATWNIAYKREAINSLGGFDESLMAGEDLDLAFRASKNGYTVIFNPDAKVSHKFQESLPQVWKTWFWYGIYWSRLFLKHPREAGGKVILALAALTAIALTCYTSTLQSLILSIFALGIVPLLYYMPLAAKMILSKRKAIYLLLPLVHWTKLIAHLTAIILGLATVWKRWYQSPGKMAKSPVK